MNWGKVGRWVLLIGSLAIGVIAGLAGFWIFEAKVPAAMQTQVLAAEARLYYIAGGIGLGLVVFVWSLIAVAISGRAAASQARRGMTAAAPPAAPR